MDPQVNAAEGSNVTGEDGGCCEPVPPFQWHKESDTSFGRRGDLGRQ